MNIKKLTKVTKAIFDKLMAAIRAEDKASANVTERVKELYSGCKTAEQFRNTRKAVNEAIDALSKDKEEAKRIKARVNAVLVKYILKPLDLVLTERGTQKRKATIAAKKGSASKPQATAKPVSKNQPASAPLHDAGSILSAIRAMMNGMDKATAKAVAVRIQNELATILATK